MEVKNKAFLELILLHSKKPKRVKELLNKDRRLTLNEKNIVRGFLLMRDNANGKAHALAKSTKTQSEPLVEAMRLYLLAGTLNNQGHYLEALKQFQNCYRLFPKNINQHLEFVILNNLFQIHMNLHHVVEAREILAVQQMILDLPPADVEQLKRLRFAFAIATEEENKATELYEYFSKNLKQIEGHELVILLIHFYHYGIVFEKWDVCEQALALLCDQKKYALTENFNYMRFLFNHLKNGAPIYIRDENFAENPTLLAELKFIRALDQNKISELPGHWAALQKINPNTFKDGYKFMGFKCVFSKCIEKHHSKLVGLEARKVKDPNLSILEAIEQKLLSEGSASREQLFYYVYGREIESKMDHNRISKYINKLKTEKSLEIKSVRGSYQLLKKAS